jgi:hypothetical protein
MNPENLYEFFTNFVANSYDAIIKRFGLNSNDQVSSVYGYLKYLIANHLGYKDLGGNYEYNAFG